MVSVPSESTALNDRFGDVRCDCQLMRRQQKLRVHKSGLSAKLPLVPGAACDTMGSVLLLSATGSNGCCQPKRDFANLHFGREAVVCCVCEGFSAAQAKAAIRALEDRNPHSARHTKVGLAQIQE